MMKFNQLKNIKSIQLKMKFTLFLLVVSSIHTAYADQSQTTYDLQCIDCHSRMTGGDGHVIYTRDERIAHNIHQLKARIAHCVAGSKADWSESDIESVTQYLNDQYYRF